MCGKELGCRKPRAVTLEVERGGLCSRYGNGPICKATNPLPPIPRRKPKHLHPSLCCFFVGPRRRHFACHTDPSYVRTVDWVHPFSLYIILGRLCPYFNRHRRALAAFAVVHCCFDVLATIRETYIILTRWGYLNQNQKRNVHKNNTYLVPGMYLIRSTNFSNARWSWTRSR